MNCSVQADRQVEHEVSRQLHSERLRERSGGARGHREQRRSRSHSRLVGARRFRAGGPARPCRSWQPHAARGERRRPLDLRPEPAPAGAFWISAAITAPLLLLAMGDFLPGPIERWLSPSVNVWLQLALAAPVVLWGGGPSFSAAGRRSRIAA